MKTPFLIKASSHIILAALLVNLSCPSIVPFLNTPVALAAPPVATPSCALDIAPSLAQRSGEAFDFTTTIGNTGPDTGFSPMMEVILPSEVTINSGTFSIGNLAISPAYSITVTDNDGGSPTTGTVTNPLTNAILTLPVGVKYALYRLPLGSFAVGQTQASIKFNATLSSVPPINVPLAQSLQTRCGFSLGADPLNNPIADPPSLSAFQNSIITPTLMTATKKMVTIDGEDETATGPNFPVTYTIGDNISNTKQLTNLSLTENLPTKEQILNITGEVGGADSITFTPSVGPAQVFNSPFAFPISIPATQPGGTLVAHYPSVTGTAADNDATLTFQVFVPDQDLGLTDILPKLSAGSVDINNITTASGTYLASPVSDTLSTPVQLHARALAIQKGRTILNNVGNPDFTPGDTVQYTLNFQVSDYFQLNNLVLEDLMSDGMTYVPGSARLSMTEDGTTDSALAFTEANQPESAVITGNPPPAYDFSAAPCSGCNLAITADTIDDNDAITPPGDGHTVLAFDVSSRVAAEPGRDDKLTGGLIGPTPAGQPTRGTITYSAIINENFIDSQTNDKSVDASDVLENTVKATAQVIDAAVPTGNYTQDGSSAKITIISPTYSKTLIAHEPQGGSLDVIPFVDPAPIKIAPGDKSVFKLIIDVPSGDLEKIDIKDYLPIPFFDVNDINTTFDTATYTPTEGVSASVPADGNIAYTTGNTGLPSTTLACPNFNPTITTDPSTNSFQINYTNPACFEKTPSTPIHIELLFSITAKPKPMANGLKIVNLATYTLSDSTADQVSSSSELIDVITSEPDLNITKGIISTDKVGATFTPAINGPVGFTAPGVNAPFTGPFSSTDLLANPIDSDLSKVDAGDKVRFAAVIENQGEGKAFDINYTDLLPVGFDAPASVADLNLKVYDASGADRTTDTQGGLFGFQATGGTSFGGDTSIGLQSGSGFFLPGLSNSAATMEGQANEGKNILVLVYELKISQAATSYQVLTNIGKLTSFASTPSGDNYVDPTDPLTDLSTTTLDSPTFTKLPETAPVGDISYTTCATPATCSATVGEAVRYRLPVVMPEGTTSFTLNDDLPTGLGYWATNGVTVDGTTGNCPEAASNFNGTLPTVNVVSPLVPGVAGSGVNLQATFTNAVVNFDNNATNNTFCIIYDTVVLSNPTSPLAKVNSATLTVGANPPLAAQTATINAKQPILVLTKTVNPTSGDAGDVVTYNLNLKHKTTPTASSADATDLSTSDTLPADVFIDTTDPNENFATDGLDNDSDGLVDGADPDEIAGTFYNVGTKTFTFNKTTTSNTSFDRLPLASQLNLTFRAKLLSSVTPSEIITNTGSIVYDSIEGASVTGIDGNSSTNGSANLNVVNISVSKAVNATTVTSTNASQFVGANEDLTIGEQVTYRITINAPESTTSNLQIIDTLPAIFRIDSASLISDATGSAAPTINLTDSNADLINDRATITFATLIPPAIPSSSPNNRQIIIDVVATVLNNAANSNGQLKTNNVTVNWTNNTGAALTATAAVDIVSPNLALQKSFTPAAGDAGDFTVVNLGISHTASSSASAYDLSLTDPVPADLTIQDFATDGVDNDNDGSTDEPDEALLYTTSVVGQNVTFNKTTTGNTFFDELPLANNLTYKFKVQINNSAFPGEAINNTATLNYDSLPGSDPNQRPFNSNDTASYSVNAIVPSKVVFATDLADTTNTKFNPTLDDLAIGEQVTYRLSVPVPESTFTNFVINDTLPNRLKVVNASIIQDDGVLHTQSAINVSDALNADGINDTVNFNFGTVTNPPDADTETIVVEVIAQVINVPANIAGGPYTNNATFNYDELIGGPLAASASVDVVEPSLSVVKTALPLTGSGGDQIEYAITLSNTGTASAYDVSMTDNPDNLLNVNTSFATDGLDNNGEGTDGDANEITGSFYDGNQFNWNFANTNNALFTKLDPGQSITVKYQATITSGVNPNQIIPNSVTYSADSYPGANAEQRVYTGSANAPITISNNSDITKELRDVDVEKVIGEKVPYRIRVKVPQATVDGLIVNDILPAGLAYVPGSAVISTSNAVDVTWDGTPQTPTEVPTSTTITAGQSQTLSFNFGNVINNNVNNAVDEYVIVEYDAVVMNTIDNNNGDLKTNTATAIMGSAGTVGPASASSVTVSEPDLFVSKTSSYTVGNTIVYQIRVENNATLPSGIAHDVVIKDVLPAGLTYTGNETLLNGPALPSVDSSGAPTITFTFPQVDRIYNNSNPIIFTFETTVSNSVASGTLLTNNVDLKGTSQPGNFAPVIPGNSLSGERTGDTADAGGAVNDYHSTSSLPLTVTRPDLSTSNKTVTDLNGGNIEANDVLKYTLTLINTGNSPANLIHVVDDIPANVNSFSITTLPATGVNNSLPAPAGVFSNGLLDFTNISLGAAGSPTDTTTIEYTVIVDPGLPDGTNIINNFTVDPATEGGPGGFGTVSTGSFFPTLSLVKTVVGPTSVNIGDPITYKVTIQNNGSAPSTNTTLTDLIPAQLQYTVNSAKVDGVPQTDVVDVDATDYGVTTPGALTLKIPSIAIGQSVIINYSATARVGSGGQSVTNTINLVDDQGSALSSNANISVKVPTSPGVGGPFGQGGGSGGGGDPGNSITSLFEDAEGNQRADASCSASDALDAAPQIVPTACLQLVPNRQLEFSDLGNDQSYAPFINTLKNTQIIKTGDFVFSGTGNHSSGKQEAKFQTGTWEFQPDRPVTRLEAVKAALVSNCIPIEETVTPPKNQFEFVDLPFTGGKTEADQFAAKVFYTALEHGVITGDKGRARPYDAVTTDETLAILLRSSSAIPTKYLNQEGSWFAKYERFAKDNGLLKNTNVENFSKQLTRKDFAKLIVRVMAYNPDPDIYGYIERVNIKTQQYDWRISASNPAPNLTAFGAQSKNCPVEKTKPVSCLEHDADRTLKFADVDKSSWSAPYIDILRTTKIQKDGDYIASGNGNQSTGRQQSIYKTGSWFFEPERNTTRLELTKMALVSNCIPVDDEVPIPANGFRFSDLPVEVDKKDDLNFFAARVFYTAYAHGIIKGENLTAARPFDDVNRIEAITILTRATKDTAKYMQSVELPYVDTSSEAWYARLLNFAWEQGLVGGEGDKTFKGDRHVKRTEMAEMLYSFMLFNDNVGIRNYAQSLSKYYGLPTVDLDPAKPSVNILQPPATPTPDSGAERVRGKIDLTKTPSISTAAPATTK